MDGLGPWGDRSGGSELEETFVLLMKGFPWYTQYFRRIFFSLNAAVKSNITYREGNFAILHKNIRWENFRKKPDRLLYQFFPVLFPLRKLDSRNRQKGIHLRPS